MRPIPWIAPHQLDGILPHQYPEFVLGFCEQAVRIHELEAVRRFKSVPLVHVTVHQPACASSWAAIRRSAQSMAWEMTRSGHG